MVVICGILRENDSEKLKRFKYFVYTELKQTVINQVKAGYKISKDFSLLTQNILQTIKT